MDHLKDKLVGEIIKKLIMYEFSTDSTVFNRGRPYTYCFWFVCGSSPEKRI